MKKRYYLKSVFDDGIKGIHTDFMVGPQGLEPWTN